MALTEDQKKWLDMMGASTLAAAQDSDRRAKAAEKLEAARAAIGPEKLDQIRDGLQKIKVKTDPQGFKENIMALFSGGKIDRPFLTDDSDAMKEFDVGADMASHEFVKGDQAKMLNLLAPIFAQAEKLRAEKDDQGEPLFDPENPAALAKAFYEPFVREGIIPENAVIDKYSEVARTMEGSLALYDERLKEFSKTVGRFDAMLEWADMAVAGLASGAKIVSAGEMMKAGFDAYGAHIPNLQELLEDKAFKADKKVADIISGAATCLTSAKKATDAIIKKSDFQSASDVLIAGIGKVLSPIQGSEFTLAFTQIASAASHGVPLVQAATQGDMSKFLNQMGGAIGDALIASNSDEGYQIAGKAIKAQFAMLAEVAVSAKDNSDAYTKIMQKAVGAGATVGKLLIEHYKQAALAELDADASLEKLDRDRQKSRTKDFFKGLDGGTDFADEKIEEAIEMPEALRKLAEKSKATVDKKIVEDLKRKGDAGAEAELRDIMNAPDKDFEKILAFGFAQDEDDPAAKGISEEMRVKSLETLLAEIQRQQKMLDYATAIASGGLASIEKLVPGLNSAAAFAKTLTAFAEAVAKRRQLLAWSQNKKDAKAAVTVQYEVMVNQYGLISEQMIVKGMNVFIQAIDTLGKAMMVMGHVAPIGVAVSAASSAADALMTAALKISTKIKMEQAWRIYKAALDNPNDRRKAREALRTNPTLAKYALAWGAVQDGNRIAQSALASCGIGPESLLTPGADEAKVVKYLETYFREDPKLLKEIPVPEKWYPGKIELTVLSWASFHKAAEDKASPKFKDTESANVAGLLHVMTKDVAALGAVKPGDDAAEALAKTKALASCDALIAALGRYRPKDTKGKPHETMTSYVDAVQARAEARKTALAA